MRLIFERGVGVPMRDGLELATDVIRPDLAERLPVVLKRTPYDRTLPRVGDLTESIDLAEAGYAVVSQDVRGRFGSGGTFEPFVNEINDGFDAVGWAAGQPWANGRVGMLGASYLGATQWLAASGAPPALQAIIPNITAADYHEGWAYQGGAFQLGFSLWWAHSDFITGRGGPPEAARERARIEALDGLAQLYPHRPLTDQPRLARWVPWYVEWLRRPARDSWWRAISPREHHSRILVPALNIGGWYDIFVAGTIDNFVGMRARGGTEEARIGGRLIIGPWSHRTIQGTGEFAERRYGVAALTASVDLAGEHRRWFDHWLKDTRGGLGARPPVMVFVMGRNEWRDDRDWPPPDAEWVPFWLHSAGRANTADGNGVLSRHAPGSAEPQDAFLYDPRNPVPSMGGPTLSQGGTPGWQAGPYDQRGIEARSDVLCYTTEPLSEPLEVIGPVELILYASSSAVDTDFTAKLVDVAPSGRPENLTDGILRARFRETLEEASPLEPGRVYEMRVAVGPTANLFRTGHRIRLEISSSNFPRFDPNTNTGAFIADESEADPLVALNRVHHDRAYPSRLILPVLRR